jgi:hypothetical protein
MLSPKGAKPEPLAFNKSLTLALWLMRDKELLMVS